MAHIDAKTSAEIQSFLEAKGGIAVVECYATWCGPCRCINNYVVQKNKSSGIPVIKVDVDESPELSQAYGIENMPTFLVIKGEWNNVVQTVVGGGPPNVDKIFKKALSTK